MIGMAGQIDVFGNVTIPCQSLVDSDPVLAKALKAIGTPHIRKRKTGFASLFKIIVGQQVSVASAKAIWLRCRQGVIPMTAKQVLIMGEEALRPLGLTRQKAHYVYGLAGMVAQKELSFSRIKNLDDEAALVYLQKIKGVGPWSAGIYLLFCEGRIDIWPPGDVALEYAYGDAAGFDKKPDKVFLIERSLLWAPWRGLAAHILWTYFAHIKDQTPQ